jgi:sugar lactone lactonase YvrE
MSELETILADLVFPEGPRWHYGRLFFSDIYANRVLTVTPDGRVETIFEHDGAVSGLGWMPNGDLLVVSVDDLKLLRIGLNGLKTTHADLSTVATYFLNDMAVDTKGRAYVGNVGYRFLEEAPRPAA